MAPEDQAGASQPEVTGGSAAKFKGKIARNKLKSAVAIAIALLLLVTLASTTDAKYLVKGWVSDSTLRVQVIDSKLEKPVSNARAKVDGKSAKANATGLISIKGIEPGKHKVVIVAPNYKTVSVERDFWDDVDLGKVELKAIGATVKIQVLNKLSGAEIPLATVNSPVGVLKTDAKGIARATLAKNGSDDGKVEAFKSGFLKASAEVSADTATTKIELTPIGQDVFLSNASGWVNVMTANLDGSGQKVLLKGTGNEGDESRLFISPDGKTAALMAARTDSQDVDGRSKYQLIAIDTTSGQTHEISPDIDEVFGWAGDRLVFRVANRVNGEYQGTSQILSWKQGRSAKKIAEAAGVFGGIIDGNSVVYQSDIYGGTSNGIFVVPAQGGKVTRVTKLTGGLTHVAPNQIRLDTYSGTTRVMKIDVANKTIREVTASSLGTRELVMAQSPSRKIAAVITRDGKRDVYLLAGSVDNAQRITELGNVSSIERWVNDSTLIVAVRDEGVLTHLAVDLSTGRTLMIADTFSASDGY